jgi:colanic acid/amylovoran biosynthesis glycosyltransferase
MMGVLQYRNNYLPLSETFIYAYLTNFTRIRPVVICRRTQNMEHFPFTKLYATSPELRGGGRWIDSLRARLGWEKPRHEKIAKIVEIEQLRLVHAHFGPDACDLLDVPCLAEFPMVCSFYGYDASSLANDPAWRKRYERLFSRGAAFFVEGNCMKGRLVALGCPEEKIRVVRIGVNPCRYRFQERHHRNAPVRLLFCGRFVEKKGLLLALAAIRKLDLSACDLEFRVIGDGELKPQILEYVRQNRMEEMVRFLGLLSHEKVIEEIEACDILFQPSVTAANGDSEGGAPTVLLEAQAAGVPIVSTRHADIPEVVVEGESAWLAREGDVDDIAAALDAMLRDHRRWPEMGRAGRAWVERNHDIAVVASQLEEIYFELAGQ